MILNKYTHNLQHIYNKYKYLFLKQQYNLVVANYITVMERVKEKFPKEVEMLTTLTLEMNYHNLVDELSMFYLCI